MHDDSTHHHDDYVCSPADVSPLGNALHCAVSAADAATQTTLVIYNQMSDDERDRWVAAASRCWPRTDVFLPIVLAAARQILHDEEDAEAAIRDEREAQR